MTVNDPDGPIYRLIEKVDGEWTGLITAGVPWLANEQLKRNARQRVFFSKPPALAYRDKLEKQGREVRLIEYHGLYTVN